MTTPDPMPVQWSNVDELVGNYVKHLRQNPTTTADIAVDLLTMDVANAQRVMVMMAATALQQLANGSA